MAILDLVIFPDERLRKPCEEVVVFDDELKSFIDDLSETMYADDGLGLAAPQVGDGRKIFVIDDSVLKEGSEPNLVVFINPKLSLSGEKINWNEGCLSFPGESVETERFSHVAVTAQNENGEEFKLESDVETDGIFTIALQHENDHLNGKLLIDFLTAFSRSRMKRRLLKYKKERGLL